MGRYTVNLVGESHYQDAIAAMTEGDPVELVAEPGNPFDPRAVRAIDDEGEVLGYLPRDGWLTRHLLDEGGRVAARIHALTGGTAGQHTGVVLEVFTAGDGPPEAKGKKPGLMERAALAAMEAAEAKAAGKESPIAARPPRQGPGCVAIGAGLFVLLAVLGTLFPGDTAPTPSAAPGPVGSASIPALPSRLSDAQIRNCNETLAKVTQAGLVRDRPSASRIDVDERLWAELPYKTKDVIAQALSCSAFGLYRPPEGQWVTVYGWRDGIRKLQLTHDGVV